MVALGEQGVELISADDILVQMQCMEIIVTDGPLDASALDGLPEPREAYMLGVLNSWGSYCNGQVPTTVPPRLAHERLGCTGYALECAAIILECDPTRGGTDCKMEHSFAQVRARVWLCVCVRSTHIV